MKILFLGGDKRYKYMMCDLSKNHSIYQVGFKYIEGIQNLNLDTVDLSDFDIILFPISGITDNQEIKTESGIIEIPNKVFKNINENTIFFTGLKTKKLLELIPENQIISFLDYKEVKDVNDSLTVDGVIENIKDMKKDTICILGYGKLGKEIYLRLKDLGITTYVLSRPKELIYTDKVEKYYPLSAQNIMEAFNVSDIVINTIPSNIIPEDALTLSNTPYILDIASSPYGINEELVKSYKDKINYKLYLGIPSVFAPEKASEILLKILYKEVIKK